MYHIILWGIIIFLLYVAYCVMSSTMQWKYPGDADSIVRYVCPICGKTENMRRDEFWNCGERPCPQCRRGFNNFIQMLHSHGNENPLLYTQYGLPITAINIFEYIQITFKFNGKVHQRIFDEKCYNLGIRDGHLFAITKQKPFSDIIVGWELYYDKYSKSYALRTLNLLSEKSRTIKVTLDNDIWQYSPATFYIDIVNVQFRLKDERKTYYEQPNC